jgi:predicted transcriptional regulator
MNTKKEVIGAILSSSMFLNGTAEAFGSSMAAAIVQAGASDKAAESIASCRDVEGLEARILSILPADDSPEQPATSAALAAKLHKDQETVDNALSRLVERLCVVKKTDGYLKRTIHNH